MQQLLNFCHQEKFSVHPEGFEKCVATKRTRQLDQFVMDQFNTNKPIPGFIDNAANLIVEKLEWLNKFSSWKSSE